MKWTNALVVVAAFVFLGWLAHLVDGCLRIETQNEAKDREVWNQFKIEHHCHLDVEHMTWNFIWHCDGIDVIHN